MTSRDRESRALRANRQISMLNATGRPTVSLTGVVPKPMPTHAATASPAPIRVQVVNGDDPFYSHTIPLVALVVACVGTVFGGLALVGIFFQLRKADKGNTIGQLGY